MVDGGDFVATAAYVLAAQAAQLPDPGVFGTLGVGGGFAVGAATVRPEERDLIIYGDGSSAYRWPNSTPSCATATRPSR